MTQRKMSLRFDTQGKSLLVAYLLWWFLGSFGLHRFYLGRVTSGFIQLVLSVSGWLTLVFLIGYLLLGIWFLWWALDAFLVYGMVEEENRKRGVMGSEFTVTHSDSRQTELEQLDLLYRLYERGAITENEYQQRKAEILGTKQNV